MVNLTFTSTLSAQFLTGHTNISSHHTVSNLTADNDGKQKKGAATVLYGTDSGSISSVLVQVDGTAAHQWTLDEPASAKRSPVTCTLHYMTLNHILQ